MDLLKVMIDQEFACGLKVLTDVPQNSATRARVGVQLLDARAKAVLLNPNSVRTRSHPMDNLGGLNLLELSVPVWLRIILDRHLYGEPRGDG
jgi:hypothetical protein